MVRRGVGLSDAALPSPAHRPGDAPRGEGSPVGGGGVLAAAIGVVDQAG